MKNWTNFNVNIQKTKQKDVTTPQRVKQNINPKKKKITKDTIIINGNTKQIKHTKTQYTKENYKQQAIHKNAPLLLICYLQTTKYSKKMQIKIIN